MTGTISATDGETKLGFNDSVISVLVKVTGTGKAQGIINSDKVSGGVPSTIIGDGDPWVAKCLGGIKSLTLVALDGATLEYNVQVIEKL